MSNDKSLGSGVLVFPEKKIEKFVYVLTAKHCLERNDKTLFAANELSIQYKSIILFCQDLLIFGQDLALIILHKTKEFEKVISSKILSSIPKDESKFYIRGYPKGNNFEPQNIEGSFRSVENGNLQFSPEDRTETNISSASDNVIGFSGSGIWIHRENTTYLVGVVTNHNAGTEYFEGELINKINETLKERKRPSVSLLNNPASNSSDKYLTFPHYLNKGKEVIGRKKELAKLHADIEKSNRVVVVNGMGGIGKTTFAQFYVDSYKDEYQKIVWLSAVKNIANAFDNEDLIKNLSIDDEIFQIRSEQSLNQDIAKNIFNLVTRKLRGITPPLNLLVIDNADTQESEKYYYEQIDLKPNWRVLLTSRITIDGFKKYSLGFLTKKPALELFFTHYLREKKDKANQENAFKIIQAIHYHTLTIELLSKTIQNNREFNIVKLLEHLQLKGIVFDDIKFNTPYNKIKNQETTINRCLSISFDLSRIKENYFALDTLSQFSVLPPIPISYELIRQILSIDENKIVEFNNVLTELVQTGWLNEDEGRFSIHPVIQIVVRNENVITPDSVANLFNNFCDLTDTDKHDIQTNITIFRPFIEGIIATFEEDMSQYNSPLIAKLAKNYAKFMRKIGDLNQSVEYAKKAIFINEKIDKEHIELADSLRTLAITLRQINKVEEGLNVYLMAFEIVQGFDKHKQVQLYFQRYYHDISKVYYSNNNIEEAEIYLKNGVSFIREHDIDDPQCVASIHCTYGLLLNKKRNFEEADENFRQGISLGKQVYSLEDPDLASFYNNYAINLSDLERFDDAILNQKEAVKIYYAIAKKNGNEKSNSYYAVALNGLSQCYLKTGNISKALESQKQSLSIKQEIRKTSNNEISISLSYSTLSEIYSKGGDEKNLSLALDYALRAIEILEKSNNRIDDLIAVYERLSVIYEQQEQWESILPILKSIIDLSTKQGYPENHIMYFEKKLSNVLSKVKEDE